MNIPASIKRRIGFRKAELDKLGCSDAQVLLFDDMVLKIAPDCPASVNEHRMMRYLQRRLPVPEILEEAHVDGTHYLLMSRMPGHNLCDEAILDNQERLAELVADGLQRLWATDIRDCPTDRSLAQKLREIEERLRQGEITTDQARHKDTYGPGGFASPAQLFDWVVKHCPKEEKVLSHGDYCLPNIFCDDNGLTGYIDLGDAGVADKWVDLEMVVWSMWANSTGQFGGKRREFDRRLLFDALDIPCDEEKLRYYSLLSELI
ncbi:MAG: aminoglycoside 3'-phosphotransferase [Clostridiales bacterium]|nr:aminoglycoside 3'-phosphotransferase [Clostridiales bacterium]